VPDNFTIAFHHLQEIMKRHKWGAPYGLPLEALSLNIRGQIPLVRMNPIAAKLLGLINPHVNRNLVASFNSEAVIRNGELLLRLEYGFREPTSKGVLRYQDLEIIAHGLLQLCPHMSFISANDDWPSEWSTLIEKVYFKLHDPDRGKPSYTTRLMLCEFCYTEIRISMTIPEFKVTVWKSLGSGQSPEADSWRRQVPDMPESESVWERLKVGLWIPGLVRAAYENVTLPWQYIEEFSEEEYDWLPVMTKEELRTLRRLGIDSRDFDPDYEHY